MKDFQGIKDIIDRYKAQTEAGRPLSPAQVDWLIGTALAQHRLNVAGERLIESLHVDCLKKDMEIHDLKQLPIK